MSGPRSSSHSEELLHCLQAQPCTHRAAVHIFNGKTLIPLIYKSLEASCTANLSHNQACIQGLHNQPYIAGRMSAYLSLSPHQRTFGFWQLHIGPCSPTSSDGCISPKGP